MNRARARGLFVSRGQEDEFVLDRGRWWARWLRNAWSARTDGRGCRRGSLLEQRVVARLGLQRDGIARDGTRPLRCGGCSIGDARCCASRYPGCGDGKDLISPASTRVLNGHRPVGVHVAARSRRNTSRLADLSTALLKRAGPGRCLDSSEEQRLRCAEPTDFDFPILRSHVIPLVRHT